MIEKQFLLGEQVYYFCKNDTEIYKGKVVKIEFMPGGQKEVAYCLQHNPRYNSPRTQYVWRTKKEAFKGAKKILNDELKDFQETTKRKISKLLLMRKQARND